VGRLVQTAAIPLRRIAVLSDVHGNLVALRAVLADLDELGVDAACPTGSLSQLSKSTSALITNRGPLLHPAPISPAHVRRTA
jgi:hypothetical protein